MARLCEIEMEGTPSSIRSARAFVRATLGAWDLEQLAETAALLTSELATNAIIHARTRFSVAVVLDGCVRVEVSDASPEAPRMEEVDPSMERGRGLRLVSHLADGWGSRPEGAGKTVWFTLALPPPAPAGPGAVPGS